MQLRHCEVMQYVEFIKVDIQRVIKEHKTIKEWAYILHDKDDTGDHYHIYLNFGKSSCDTALIAKWFEIEEQYVNKVQGRKSDVLLYLIHGNDTQKDKHQYLPSEVISNFDYQNALLSAKIIGDFKNYSYAQQLDYVHSLPVGEKTKAFTQLEKLWKIECQAMTLKTERNIEVVFIYGKAGTGKTYYAKKMLSELGYDFCISSSSNDPFQDYLGQKAIILDDLRSKNKPTDSGFEFEDLLKILDNNTNSTVRSRFNNKVFNGEMIVITTPVPLNHWYWQYKTNANDTLEQLYRRITCYIEVTRDWITVYDDVDSDGKPCGNSKKYKNAIPELKKKREEKTNFHKLFTKLCQTEPVQLSLVEDEDLPF